MQELLDALDENARTGNWYGALFVALSLPDICGKIEYVGESSSKRYAAWFEKYVQRKYTSDATEWRPEFVFLSGDHCYALRCAFLHEGSDDVSRHRAREAVTKFHFIVAPVGYIIHCNNVNDRLQLQVNIFCKDIRDGVVVWLRDIETDQVKSSKVESLLKIQFPDANGGIRI